MTPGEGEFYFTLVRGGSALQRRWRMPGAWDPSSGQERPPQDDRAGRVEKDDRVDELRMDDRLMSCEILGTNAESLGQGDHSASNSWLRFWDIASVFLE